MLFIAGDREAGMTNTLRIYGDSISGNCDKVRFTANYLAIPYEWVETSAVKGETRGPEFLSINPWGEVPALVLPDGKSLWQSNAIIQYLADGSRLLPSDAYLRARVNAWLFWEQYSHEPYIAVIRAQLLFRGYTAETLEPWRVERGNKALDFMERHLRDRDWLVGHAMTVADISLLAYTRFAHEGNFDLATRPKIGAWIARTEQALRISPVERHPS
jgi:glutathione S-transferase